MGWRINHTRKALWAKAANDNLPEEEWSWEVVMLLAHTIPEEVC